MHEQTALHYSFRSCEATSAITTEQPVIAHGEHTSNMGFGGTCAELWIWGRMMVPFLRQCSPAADPPPVLSTQWFKMWQD